VDLRVIARDEHQDEAEKKANSLVRYLEESVGKYIYGRDRDTLESVVGQLLIDNDKTLSVAESCTAGTLGEAITDVPGASRYFVGGVLSYANEVKINLLKVDPDIINEHGAVSQECAIAMAAGCRHLLGTDYALAITGIAGPDGGTDDKPVGTVYIGLASAHRNAARLFRMNGERDVIRHRAVFAALEFLRRDILDIE
jgi:nicotinamide-nucleotide amidase